MGSNPTLSADRIDPRGENPLLGSFCYMLHWVGPALSVDKKSHCVSNLTWQGHFPFNMQVEANHHKVRTAQRTKV